jgi:DNA-directed RNA polymerase subunit RPC12/RpoP
MVSSGQGQVALRLVHSVTGPWTWFCSHCGGRYDFDAGAERLPLRVCDSCSMGVLLKARSDAAPRSGGAFLIADSSLTVQAVSAAGETALGVRELDAVNRPVTKFLMTADAEKAHSRSLAEAITSAVSADQEPVRVVVRPTSSFGVRLSARISGCGPPRAALLTLE